MAQFITIIYSLSYIQYLATLWAEQDWYLYADECNDLQRLTAPQACGDNIVTVFIFQLIFREESPDYV